MQAAWSSLVRRRNYNTQPIDASPLWLEQVRLFAKELGMSTVNLIASIKGIGPIWKDWQQDCR